jgi:VWA domain containing CoxE-like protein
VALLDISGSMEPYARAYLHLLWGAAARAQAEVFVFGTRLTRLTRALRNANPDLALERAAALMPDWSGRTRIGHAVRDFMDLYGRRGMARGAVVLIVSDGWERDDPILASRWPRSAGMLIASYGPTRGRPRQALLRWPAAWRQPFRTSTHLSAVIRPMPSSRSSVLWASPQAARNGIAQFTV